MAVLTTSLHMSPAIRNQDLHFIDEAVSAGLRAMRVRFLPPAQPVVDDPIDGEPRHPVDRRPATEAVLPQAHVDFRQGQPGPALRVDRVVGPPVIADADGRVQPHAFRRGAEFVVRVDQAAFRAFQVLRRQAVR